MIALQCKVCGGDIELTGDAGTCRYCGAAFSLGGCDDDTHLELMNRANEARRKNDFDEAIRAWRMLATEAPRSAEAHWNLALSRFGIAYIYDRRLDVFVPTINRLRFERFSEDPDYRAAMLCADEDALVYYQQEASQIQTDQDRLLELVRSQTDYDVFISFKAEDATGQRTRDAVLAQEIYERLTAKGLRVFFSRVSLQQVSGQQYEPYIFQALQSAKVMVVVGTRLDFVTAPWVKNEWQRYLALMEQDQGRSLVMAYESLLPEFFPEELRLREAIDLRSPGALLDLTDGVVRLLGRENVAASRAEYQRLIERMHASLQARSFAEVVQLGRDALAADATGAEAWWMLLLAEQGLTDEYELVGASFNWMDSRYFGQAYALANSRRKQLLDGVRQRWQDQVAQQQQDQRLTAEAQMSAMHTREVVSQARALMLDGQFVRAYALLSDNVIPTDEIVALRDDAELGAEYERIDTGSFLRTTLERERPDIMGNYAQLQREHIGNESPLPGPAWLRLLLCALLSFGCIVLYVLHISSGILSMLAIVALVAGLLLLSYTVFRRVDNLTLRTILIVATPFIVAVVFGNLTLSLPSSLREYVPLAGVVLMLALGAVSVYDLLVAARHKAHSKRVTHYYVHEVMPLESKLIKRYEERYAPLTTYEPLKELKRVL